MARGKELTGRIPPMVHDALRHVADAYNTTMNAILTEALIEHLGSKYGLTVRPLSAQNGITLVETTWAHKALTERPECAPAAPIMIPPSAHMGGIGGDHVISKPTKIKTKKERDPFVVEMIDLAKQHGMLGTRQERVDKWVNANKPDDATKQRIREAVGGFYLSMPASERNYNKIGAVFESEKWNDWTPTPPTLPDPVFASNPHPCGHPDWLYVERRSLGKKSTDYQHGSREWAEHKAVETGLRPEPTKVSV